MPSPLSSFLARNSVAAAEGLPLIHTTKSFNFRAIMSDGELKTQPCDVFTEERLNYFFVGRPAYKYKTENSTAEPWELPCCFIFEFQSVGAVKRMFPFDSGAFDAGLYPPYINSMPLSNFECTDSSTPEKIIGSFFGTRDAYLKLQPKDRAAFEQEYSLTPFDAELSAAIRLAAEKTPTSFDDRRFTIEVQSETDIVLSQANPLAVILPEVYLDIEGVLDKIQNQWHAEPIGYAMYPLSVSMYYAHIYAEVDKFYKRRGLI